jgi:hypothetical protein
MTFLEKLGIKPNQCAWNVDHISIPNKNKTRFASRHEIKILS